MNIPADVVSGLRKKFLSGKTKSVQWRLDQLKSILNLIQENESEIKDALYKDLRKPAFESDLFEMTVVKNEIVYAIKNLSSWMKPTYPTKSLVQYMDTLYTQHEPFGVVLIISAWNYPLQLMLNPVVAAMYCCWKLCVNEALRNFFNDCKPLSRIDPQVYGYRLHSNFTWRSI